jgi:hypothetical protein
LSEQPQFIFMPVEEPPEVEELRARAESIEAEQHASLFYWSAVLCTCRPWYDRRLPVPQSGCLIHAALAVYWRVEG